MRNDQDTAFDALMAARIDAIPLDEQFATLKQLVADIRARLPPLSQAEYDAVGMYMLKAFYTGENKRPTTEILEPWPTSTPPPRMRLVETSSTL